MAVITDSSAEPSVSSSSGMDATAHTHSSGASSSRNGNVSTSASNGASSQSGSQVDGPGKSSNQAGSSGMSAATNWDRVDTAKSTLDVAKSKLKESPADYENAIDLLDQVCVILKEELGDLNIDTCDALYYYGSALLENYQIGSDLMGNKANTAVRQYPTDPADDSKPSVSTSTSSERTIEPNEATSSAVEQSNEIVAQSTEAEAAAKDSVKDDDTESSSNESDLESLPGGGPLDGADETLRDEDDDDDMEDESLDALDVLHESTPDDGIQGSKSAGKAKSKQEGDAIAELRYAWEILEISRVGYEKRLREGASHKEKLRLSDIHYKLSLCAAENGDQNVAIVEAERSLKVCQECCGPTDRDLAEAFFNLGSVYSMYSLLTEAADNMKKAVAILEARKVQVTVELQLLQSDVEDRMASFAKQKPLEKQLTELNELIPDLMRRIQDTYEDMRLGSDEAKRLLENWLKGVSDKCHTDAGVPVTAPAPISDISHLVRRVPPKRSSAAVDEEESTKRVKGANGMTVDGEFARSPNGLADHPVAESVSEPKI